MYYDDDDFTQANKKNPTKNMSKFVISFNYSIL